MFDEIVKTEFKPDGKVTVETESPDPEASQSRVREAGIAPVVPSPWRQAPDQQRFGTQFLSSKSLQREHSYPQIYPQGTVPTVLFSDLAAPLPRFELPPHQLGSLPLPVHNL